MNLSRLSFYNILGFIVAVSVMSVMLLQSIETYRFNKVRIIEDLKLTSSLSMATIKHNLAHLIDSYAINEYEKLVANQMQRKDFKAIVVKDFNMGEILGSGVYVTGSIRNENWQVIEFDGQSVFHREALQNCFSSETSPIINDSGSKVGLITICTTDKFVKAQLENLMIKNMIVTLSIAVLLMGLLFWAIRYYLFAPITRIVRSLNENDPDGIPKSSVPVDGSKEIVKLSEVMNKMIQAIRRSRKELEQKHKELMDEKERFELAVEGALDGLWDWNLQTDEVVHSAQFETMLGYEVGELPDSIECWKDLLHPDDYAQAMEVVGQYLDKKGEGVYENTFRMKTKSGEWRWISGRGKALFSEDDVPLRFVGFNTDVTDRVLHQQALDHSAKHDSLTVLPNRFLFNELIQKALSHATRSKTWLALLYFDLDGFKEINDTHGHEAGDLVLVQVAKRIKRLIRQEDISARLGGDEFAVAVTNLPKKEDVVPFLERLLNDLKEPVYYKNNRIHELKVTASIGVTFYPQEMDLGSDALLRQADQAMYEAKSSGKNKYHLFNIDEDLAVKELLKQVAEFEKALDEGQLMLYFQPRVNMENSHVYGVEALLRWNHPGKGFLFPDSFLPAIRQEKEVMLRLGRWVVEAAFEELSKLLDAGYDLIVSINISSHELKDEGFKDFLVGLLERYPEIMPKHIELEILESNALEDIEQARKMIVATQALGIKISLDDFGTGYSTLSYLKDLPIDIIKIDKGFVMDMLYDRASFSIIEAALGLANAFRCEVVAEGVETVEHGEFLLNLGCKFAQGYIVARPMPADLIIEWIGSYQGYTQWESAKYANDETSSLIYALVEHRHWIRMLENHINDPVNKKQPELDSQLCRFGSWLRETAHQLSFSEKEIQRLDDLHELLHEIAHEMVNLRNEASKPEKLKEIREVHKQILSELNKFRH